MSEETGHELSRIVRERLRGLPSAHARAPETLVHGLRARVEAESGPAAGRPVAPWWHLERLGWLVPAATLVVGVVVGLLLARPHRHAVFGQEVPVTVQNYLDDVSHDGYLFAQLTRPLELASSDVDAASTWLDAGLPFHAHLARPPQGWQLQGVRIWHTVSRLSALAEMADEHGEQVLLFAVPAAEISFDAGSAVPTSEGPVYLGQGWGYQAVAWRSGDLAWSAVSHLPRETLLSWLKAYRASS